MGNDIKLSAVYIGLVIGAGFASGREIMTFFNDPSSTNITGVLLAAFLFMLIPYAIGYAAIKNSVFEYQGYINHIAGRAAPFVKPFMTFYMFCGSFTMYAGSGALFAFISPFSYILGVILMAFITFMVLSFDIKGIVTLNLILVPLMILGIILICTYFSVFNAVPTFKGMPSATYHSSPFLDILFYALCYAAYNTLTVPSVLVPLCDGISLSKLKRACIFSGFLLGFIIFLVWRTQGTLSDSLSSSDLPMLIIAALCGKNCKRIYTMVLFMAITTTAVSNGYGVMSYFSEKIKSKKERTFYAAILTLSGIPPALYGFSSLVANLYFFFGIAGIFWLILTLYFWLFRK